MANLHTATEAVAAFDWDSDSAQRPVREVGAAMGWSPVRLYDDQVAMGVAPIASMIASPSALAAPPAKTRVRAC